jgi:hypothetical protein
MDQKQYDQLMEKLSGIDYQLTALLGVKGIIMPHRSVKTKDPDSCSHEFSYYTSGGWLCPMCGSCDLRKVDSFDNFRE